MPRASGAAFPQAGSHLERYGAVFNAAEINSSFYRSHRRETYARWASTVSKDFRFSVKLPREITHQQRLRACATILRRFLDEVEGLGARLGCLLIQLPPSLAYERATATRFFSLLRRHFSGHAMLEARHATWFDPVVTEALRAFDVCRIGSDPALVAAAASPSTTTDAAYWRLHGSPRMYYSSYAEDFLQAVAAEMRACDAGVRERWCIFDNTASGFATANALRLNEILKGRGRAGVDRVESANRDTRPR